LYAQAFSRFLAKMRFAAAPSRCGLSLVRAPAPEWPAFCFFNQVVEQDLSSAAFAPEAGHRAIASSSLSIAVMHSPFAHRSKSSPEYLADLQSVHVRKQLRSREPRGSVGLARWSKYPADLISAEQPLQYDIG
jgi:hypothetical protein